ncbi:ATP phosphoribosyltransferase regulatory subunit [Devosia sp. ZB163]|uniref:ATP phosphoribosyltransferase regulatory subunit n=1 Tax=Devosia sp. ZB163 TaxID=3025938 RepID=UPI002361206D|nr:ATP phosphoribosyltransferase regulatory subunit [Devosia sp. ZB163]MDC9823554.1 ATP phosphoribosyltransferase regulatory subunit [Devosia sp. ZB163]
MKTASERYAALVRLVESRTVTRANVPLLLPAGPYFDLAGEEFGRNLLLTTTNNGVEYCLRPDFTLPIAQQYLEDGLIGAPSAFTYLGPIFRQESSTPVEFEQAGLELLGQPDADNALDQVLTFARWALAIYDITAPNVRLGGVGLFEAFLEAADIPTAWRSRIRHRFGHPEAMARLMDRLANPEQKAEGPAPDSRDTVIEIVTDAMLSGGLSLIGSRTPEEIADRYLEKQALDAAPIAPETVMLLQNYLDVADSATMAFERIADLAKEAGFDFDEPLYQVRNHAAALQALSPNADVVFDASFSPRLDYYTGIVFEMTGSDGEVLASGGEYDRMLERLGADEPIKASGCALWVDRLEREASQ